MAHCNRFVFGVIAIGALMVAGVVPVQAQPAAAPAWKLMGRVESTGTTISMDPASKAMAGGKAKMVFLVEFDAAQPEDGARAQMNHNEFDCPAKLLRTVLITRHAARASAVLHRIPDPGAEWRPVPASGGTLSNAMFDLACS